MVRITSLAQSTSDTEVAAAVDVGYGEAGLAFDRLGKAGVVFLSKDVVDELLVRPNIDQGRDKIALQAVRRREVDHELLGYKRSVLDAAATCSANNAEGVCLRCGFNLDAVTAESCIWLPDLRVEDARRLRILGLGVQRPVPVGLAAGVAAFFS